MRKAINLLIILFTVQAAVFAQANKKTLSEAERFYGIKAYDQALPLFVEAIKAGEKDPMVHYKAGVCYQKSPNNNEQIKAIPYWEYAAQINHRKFPDLYPFLGSFVDKL